MSAKRREPSGGEIFRYLDGTLSGTALTARRAASFIAIATLFLTVAGGLLICVANREEFENIGKGLWWSVQTLTTVGYGDVVPTNTWGKIIGTIIMLNGIAFLTVITAAVTATLIDQVHQRRAEEMLEDVEEAASDPVLARLDEIGARLDEIERALKSPEPPGD